MAKVYVWVRISVWYDEALRVLKLILLSVDDDKLSCLRKILHAVIVALNIYVRELTKAYIYIYLLAMACIYIYIYIFLTA